MWSTFAENAKKGLSGATKNLTEVMEKAGDSITQAASKVNLNVPHDGSGGAGASAGQNAAASNRSGASDNGSANSNKANPNGNGIKLPNVDVNAEKEKLINNFKMGWSSVVETTKRSLEATEGAIKMQQQRLEQNLPFGPGKRGANFYKRDPGLPLDVEALRDAEVVYITDRIITMGHPAMASNTNPNITAQRKLAAISHLLQRRHDGRHLVWNLSEVNYDLSILDDQVLTFSFPGSPAPPLGLLLKLLVSMENWMKADDRNVAVVHCLTGKGRTSIVLAAFLSWMGEAGFGDITQALAYIAKCKKLSPEKLTIPSQRRYASYFKNMLDGVRPSQPPILLKRIIMSTAPKYAKGPARESPEGQDGQNTGSDADNEQLMGCAPYLQIFKGGELLFTTAATLHINQKEEELPFVQGVDGPVPFHVDQIVQGDILIRCRHLTFKKQRVSMFRAAFHTGYVPPNVMRLTKSQLDGACADKRFSDDFFLDFIFEKVDAETATKHLEDASAAHGDAPDKDDAAGKRQAAIVKATSYDTMLQGESKFWDVIAARRKEHAAHSSDDVNSDVGKTVGQRRKDGKTKGQSSVDGGSGGPSSAGAAKQEAELETFSIGGELDFLPKGGGVTDTSQTKAQSEKGRDSLMEALDALDEDDTDKPQQTSADLGTETIVFESPIPSANNSVADDKASPAAQDGDASIATEKSEQQQPPSETQSNASADVLSKSDLDDMEAMLSMDVGDDDLDFGDFDVDEVDEHLEDLESLLKM